MALFDNDKDTKEKGNNIADRIEKDIKKRKNVKPKGRGTTKKTIGTNTDDIKVLEDNDDEDIDDFGDY